MVFRWEKIHSLEHKTAISQRQALLSDNMGTWYSTSELSSNLTSPDNLMGMLFNQRLQPDCYTNNMREGNNTE